MLPTLLGSVGDAFVQVTTILGVFSGFCDIMKFVRITAVGAIVVGCVVPAMCVVVILVSVRLGSSAVVITGEPLVVIGICPEDICWSSSTAAALAATASSTTSRRIGDVTGLADGEGSVGRR